MSYFYTFFGFGWNEILVSGYRDGKKFHSKVNYQPFLFTKNRTDTPSIYHTVDGVSVNRVDFNNISEARNYAKHIGTNCYGNTDYPYVYAHEHFTDMVSDSTLIRVGVIDIETDSQNGFGNIQAADRAITSITIKVIGEKDIHVLGLKPYQTTEPELLNADWNIKYNICASEKDLLFKLVQIWNKLRIDVITNWNGELFDIPYIIKRITQVISEEYARTLSPFNKIEKMEIMQWGKSVDKYKIVGIPNIDYLAAYRKFNPSNEESFKLEAIAAKVLGVGKLDYSEYGSLAKLYLNNHNKFIDYNIIDVLRIEQMDEHLKLLDLVFIIAHFAKVNFEDTFGTIKTWDTMIHNYLLDRNCVVPPTGTNRKLKQIAGAYVKEPKPNMYPNIMSFDLTSLYPHLIMQYNISPEMLVGIKEEIADQFSVDKILRGDAKQFKQYMVDNNVTISGKGTVFSKRDIGFLPKLMKDLFAQRKANKDKMLQNEGLVQDIKTEMAKRGIHDKQ